MSDSNTFNDSIFLTHLKKADDYNTQILTNIGTYVSLITSDSVPNTKQIKKLILSIEKPLGELVRLCAEPHFSKEMHEKIKELEKYKLEISDSIEKKEEVSSETTNRIVNLYHHTSDIDNMIFDLLYSE